MNVYVKPLPTTLSRAMHRVADALQRHAPAGVRCVDLPEDADLQVLHVVSPESMLNARAKEHAVIQYCYRSTGASSAYWREVFQNVRLAWSYYDLSGEVDRFYHAPMGVDVDVFEWIGVPWGGRKNVFTSGYVSGPVQEAIEEVALAAAQVGLAVVHLGPPKVVGMQKRPRRWTAHMGLSDTQLALLYGSSRWVSGLRHIEGFEMPVIEGFACGARPIVFDRPEMRQWFGDLAEFVPESHGPELVGALTKVLQRSRPVSRDERDYVISRFSWKTIVTEFWKRVL